MDPQTSQTIAPSQQAPQADPNWSDAYQPGPQAKTEAATDRKCPSCGAAMNFDPATGGLFCPYCKHTEAIQQDAAKPASAQEADLATAEQTANCDWGAAKKVVSCKSCGAQSVYDALQIADVCPYCGSNQVMESHDQSTMAPGGVCVFKVDDKQAGERFKAWLGKKLFTPKVAKEKAKPKSFQGVYLPFWTFDADTFSQYSGRYGVTRTVRDREGNTRTEIDWYPVSGSYQAFIDDQLVAASTQHDLAYLQGLEPFNTADNLTYKPEYVAGFAAERYSVGLKDGWENGKQFIYSRLHSAVESKVMGERGSSMVEIDRLNVQYSNITFKYLLLPVWMSSFCFKDKIFHFMVNGQTGKVAGKVPISPLRVAIAVVLGLALAGLLYWMFSQGDSGSYAYLLGL